MTWMTYMFLVMLLILAVEILMWRSLRRIERAFALAFMTNQVGVTAPPRGNAPPSRQQTERWQKEGGA